MRTRPAKPWPFRGVTFFRKALDSGFVGLHVQEATDTKREAVAASSEIIGAKWTSLIIYDLGGSKRRFRELEQLCEGISSRTLAERLRQLEREGIVRRHSYPESPPRVEYELTDKGEALLPIIDAMRRFGRAWLAPKPARRRRRRDAVASGR